MHREKLVGAPWGGHCMAYHLSLEISSPFLQSFIRLKPLVRYLSCEAKAHVSIPVFYLLKVGASKGERTVSGLFVVLLLGLGCL